MPSKKIAISVFLTIIFILLSVIQVVASGVGFSPGRLGFDDNSKTEATTLYVINTGQETSNYQVYAEANYEGWFNISPSEFSLNPNEHKPVTISLSSTDVPVGEHNAKLCVVAFAKFEDAKIGTGAKVPVHIAITSPIPEPVSQSETLLTESTPSPTVVLTTDESTGPVQVELWIGIAIVLIVATVTLTIVIRRRKRVESQ